MSDNQAKQEDQQQSPEEFTLGDLAASCWDLAGEIGEPITTGYSSLDTILSGGLFPGRLMVLAGGPGGGKTSMVNQIAFHVAAQGRAVYFLTLEEMPLTLLAKTISRLGHIDYGKAFRWDTASRGTIDFTLERHVVNSPASTHLAYYHPRDTILVSDLRDRVQQHFSRFDVTSGGLVVVDYLQCFAQMARRSEGRHDLREIITGVTRELRTYIAEALKCTVLATSSMNRASNYTLDNVLMSLKEDGNIEYFSDVVMAVAPGSIKVENGKASEAVRTPPLGYKAYTLIVAKNRIGEKMVAVDLNWSGRFQDMQDAEIAESTQRASSVDPKDNASTSSSKPTPVGKQMAEERRRHADERKRQRAIAQIEDADDDTQGKTAERGFIPVNDDVA